MQSIGFYPLNQVIHGDSRELAKSIPDNSIDLIFTDPIYDQEQDYIWLAETSKRILKSSGLVLCWSNGKWHYQNTKWLESAGLNYRYDFANIMIRAVAPMNGHIVSRANRVIWLDKNFQSKMIGYLIDGASTTVQKWTKSWAWSKSEKFCEMALEAFADENSIVYDPFAGYASIPATCKYFGYKFIASEIDETMAKKSSIRLSETAYAPRMAIAKPNTASSRLFEGLGELPAVANQSESESPA